MEHRAPLSDDGVPLEVKEGIVLDRDGRPLTMPASERPEHDGEPASAFGGVRVYRPGPWIFLLMAALIPLFLVAGFAIFLVIGGLGILFVTLRSLARALGGTR